MKKTIWFINKDAAPIEEFGAHLRTVKQAQFFQCKGYNVKVVCSSIVHNRGINHVTTGLMHEEMYDNVPFLFIKSINYKNNVLIRVIAYFLFTINVWRTALNKGVPDIIVHTSKLPFDLPIFWFSRFIHSKYIIDVTDLWPMEFEHFGYLKKKNPILSFFYKIERYVYSKADSVVMSFEGCHEYIKEKKWDKEQGGPIDLSNVYYINNGLDLKVFNYDNNNYSLNDTDLENQSLFKVVYLGSIRKANNLITLIDAAKEVVSYPNIRIIIYGDGDERLSLEERCRKESITNVIFKDKWIDPKYVPYVLTHASLNLLNYAKGWAPYGGSMNKMFMSFAAGKPILCNAGMRFSPIRDNELGIDECFENAKAYAEAILKLKRLSSKELKEIELKSENLIKDFDTNVLNSKFAEVCNL